MGRRRHSAVDQVRSNTPDHDAFKKLRDLARQLDVAHRAQRITAAELTKAKRVRMRIREGVMTMIATLKRKRT